MMVKNNQAGHVTHAGSRPTRVYRCPEARQDPRVFCYAAKAHPEIASIPEELIITYVTNSLDIELIRSDASLYRPRFLRIRFTAQETIEEVDEKYVVLPPSFAAEWRRD